MHRRMMMQSIGGGGVEAFILEVNTALGDGLNQMRMPIQGTDMEIDWGDGTTETVTQTAIPASANWVTHFYASGGIYDITITNLELVYFNNGGDDRKVTELKSWGVSEWNSFVRSFFGCTNIDLFDTPVPEWLNVTDLTGTWANCTSLFIAPDVSALTNVKDLGSTWRDCTSLTTAPDVSALVNVTSLKNTWNNCSSLTTAPDVSALVNVTTLRETWNNCSSLTTAPDVSALTNVTTLRETWRDCSSLSTAPDVSALTNVTNLQITWFNCTSLTELPLIGFHIENVNNAANMATGVTATNYDAILVDFEARLESLYPSGVGYPYSGLEIHFGNSTYTIGSAAETARTNLINNFGWNITDGGGI